MRLPAVAAVCVALGLAARAAAVRRALQARKRVFGLCEGEGVVRRALVDTAVMSLMDVATLVSALTRPALLWSTLHAKLLSGASTVPLTRKGCHLDVHAAGTAGPHVLFVHGGAWCWGSGVLYSGFARALAEALDTTVYLLSYPLFPFAHVDDMAASVREASRAAAELAGHPVVVVGHSSGGHLASLSVLMDAHAAPPPPSPPPSLSGSETPPTDVGAELRRPAHPTVRAVVALCAPLHIADHYRHEASRTIKAGSIVLKRGVADISPMAPACGGPANFDSVSPAVLVAATPPHAAVPPHVLVHTRADTTVPVTSSERMHKACQDGRVPSRLVLVPGDHASVITDVMLGTGECGTIHDIIRSVDGVGVCVGVGDAAGVGVGYGSLEV